MFNASRLQSLFCTALSACNLGGWTDDEVLCCLAEPPREEKAPVRLCVSLIRQAAFHTPFLFLFRFPFLFFFYSSRLLLFLLAQREAKKPGHWSQILRAFFFPLLPLLLRLVVRVLCVQRAIREVVAPGGGSRRVVVVCAFGCVQFRLFSFLYVHILSVSCAIGDFLCLFYSLFGAILSVERVFLFIACVQKLNGEFASAFIFHDGDGEHARRQNFQNATDDKAGGRIISNSLHERKNIKKKNDGCSVVRVCTCVSGGFFSFFSSVGAG